VDPDFAFLFFSLALALCGCPQEDLNVDEAFQTIARNALKNEAEEELYIPDTVDVNAQAAPRRAQSSCC
jgi:Ras-related protein Rab-7A